MKRASSRLLVHFLDETQSYPHLMTMLKFLNGESRYRFITRRKQV